MRKTQKKEKIKKSGKKKALETFFDYLQITGGAVMVVLSFNLFFVPLGIVPGGFTGLSTVINHLTGFPIGAAVALLNVPLFLLSFRYEGRRTFIRSVYAVLMVSLLLELLPNIKLTDDLLLASVLGGAMMGAGLGLAIRGQATTGGTDMAAKLLSKLFKSALGIGVMIFLLDFVVVAFSGIVYGISRILYAFIALFVSSRVIDTLQEGLTSAKMVFIISENTGEIADLILSRMNRGVTYFRGEGAYSGEEKKIVMCVVSRFEIVRLKQMVQAADPYAFVIVNDSREILGRGFSRDRN